jgi:hypothetical protein
VREHLQVVRKGASVHDIAEPVVNMSNAWKSSQIFVLLLVVVGPEENVLPKSDE